MEQKKQYITRAGWHRLHDELNHLWKCVRPRATQAVAEAAALGDRAENAEYLYGKKALREIDRRIVFLQKRLALLHIVEPNLQPAGRVFFGAWVTVINQQASKQCYRLVGSDEIDLSQQWISIHSPVARALLGKQVDDTVTVSTPKGTITYTIVAIDDHLPDCRTK